MGAIIGLITGLFFLTLSVTSLTKGDPVTILCIIISLLICIGSILMILSKIIDKIQEKKEKVKKKEIKIR